MNIIVTDHITVFLIHKKVPAIAMDDDISSSFLSKSRNFPLPREKIQWMNQMDQLSCHGKPVLL